MTAPRIKVEMTRDYRGFRAGDVLEVPPADARIGQLLGFLRVVDPAVSARLRATTGHEFLCVRGLHIRGMSP